MKSTPPARATGNLPVAAVSDSIAWEAAFEAMPEAALVLDGEGRLLGANGAARVMLGRRAQVGAPCCTVLGCRPGACVSVRGGRAPRTAPPPARRRRRGGAPTPNP